jgi:hypothetical protein
LRRRLLSPLIVCDENFVIPTERKEGGHVVSNFSEEQVHNEAPGVEVPQRKLVGDELEVDLPL